MTPKFTPGSRVRVRAGSPPGHFRTPVYIQGKVGRIERIHGAFRNPESLAHGGDGLPRRTLYLVGFGMDDVWGDRTLERQRVFVDLYEHWLEPAAGSEDD
ncbi:MAG: SH3-like domain-containing protein [Thermoplasmata archaeon]